MLHRVQSLMNDLTRHFHADDFHSIIGHYDFPVQLRMEERSMVLMRPRDMEALLRSQAEARATVGYVKTTPRIIALELPRRGRFRAWVTYHHLTDQMVEVAQSDRILHLRDRGARLVIEAVEITRIPIPFSDMRRWKPSRRLSA